MLNAKNLGLAGGIIFGACMFLTTLVSVPTGYAESFLNAMATVYPGYSVTWLGAFVGLVYGFVDVFIALYVLGWIYNKLEKKQSII